MTGVLYTYYGLLLVVLLAVHIGIMVMRADININNKTIVPVLCVPFLLYCVYVYQVLF